MTPEQVVATIRRRLRNKANDSSINLMIVGELNAAQEALSQGEWQPWFLRTSTTLPHTSNSEFTLPTDCKILAVDSNNESTPVVYIHSDGNSYPLERRPFLELFEKFNYDAENGIPLYYCVIGDDGNRKIKAFPLVSSGSVAISYVKEATLIENETSEGNAWYEHASNLLLNMALTVLASDVFDLQSIAQVADQRAKDALKAVQNLEVANEMEDTYHSKQPLLTDGYEGPEG